MNAKHKRFNRRPTHPGLILREDVLPSVGISQAIFANYLGLSSSTVSKALNEKSGVSAQLAVRISRIIGGSLESWLRMQGAVNVWEVQGITR
ncbi:HigA family addiction module antitoxin [Polynucleobacter necessarius]|uniref:HigA family addiction module antitoxin n=1 Tax=Polynucleobacter necessarius TaxID=576610 RepID=UPI000E09CEA9